MTPNNPSLKTAETLRDKHSLGFVNMETLQAFFDDSWNAAIEADIARIVELKSGLLQSGSYVGCDTCNLIINHLLKGKRH